MTKFSAEPIKEIVHQACKIASFAPEQALMLAQSAKCLTEAMTNVAMLEEKGYIKDNKPE